VFARLGLDGARLHGRYLYERIGKDIALEGTAQTSGAVHFVEGALKSPTGTFDGACDASESITGTWRDAGKSGPFHFDPVPPSDTPVAATHRHAFSRPVVELGPNKMKECKYEESWIELFGLRNSAAERALAKQGLEVRPEALIAKDEVDEVSRCETGVGAQYGESLLDGAFREIATIETGGSLYMDGAAHPMNFLYYSRISYDLRTGRAITGKDLFARPVLPLVLKCVAASMVDDEVPRDMWESGFSEGQFDLTEEGVHFFGQGYPHFAGAYTGQGPVIGWDVLLQGGYLRGDSPVKRAWTGVKPAAKDADPCAGGFH
jgi:hypothetical protein